MSEHSVMMKPPPDVSGPPPDAERSESGLAWKVLKEGDGVGNPSYKSTV